ncbi:MAG TPA: PIN domain-containing protein [Candidatus Competibacteraceae bacterium]|nr:PIN domain-containing protein [Candidatus Competibacteraceae bacterium]
MSAVDFFDSNVLIYLFDDAEPTKQRMARQRVAQALAEGTGCISHQVVQETLNVLTGKFQRPASNEDAQHILERVLAPLWRVMPTVDLYTRALDLHERYRYSFYDSLILAAALEAGCARLYSEDLQDGQQIEGLTIENPFRR